MRIAEGEIQLHKAAAVGNVIVLIGASTHQGQVRAGAEGPACTGEDDDADVGVLPRCLDCKDQLVDQPCTERISLLRSVEGERTDVAIDAVEELFEGGR